MATNCNDLIRGMNPDCSAVNKVGGVDKTVYVGKKANMTFTTDSNGYYSAISMATIGSLPSYLLKFTGKRDKNSWTAPLTAGENVNTWNHTALMALYYSNPTELDTIEKLCNADDLVVIMQGNDDKFMVLGAEKGINASAGEGGSGILLNDTTAYMVTLTGEQKVMPKMFSTTPTSSLATNIAYLDAIATY